MNQPIGAALIFLMSAVFILLIGMMVMFTMAGPPLLAIFLDTVFGLFAIAIALLIIDTWRA